MAPIQPYKITPPAIVSGGTYLFTTDSGLEYEVRFARKKDNILHATVAFGVLNDEFGGEEYSVTNRGEVFKVMSTMVEVVKIYLREHPNLHTVEFTGEPKEDENSEMPTQRLLLYKRYLKTIFGDNWTFQLQGNRMLVKRKL
ncbi:MAG TPA: hypothetical protein VD905_08575 [Flavobacteriales bacterium]|nr:hypothetical protein [Flavobacteriales bacterium]